MGTNWRAVKAEDELTTLRADLAAALERVKGLEANEEVRSGEEDGRWQQAIYDLIREATGADTEIDGGGCDSGDPLDFTLDEISQGFNYLKNKHDQERDQLKAEGRQLLDDRHELRAERDQLKRERDEFKESYRLAMVSVNHAYDQGRRQGFEDCREVAAKLSDDQVFETHDAGCEGCDTARHLAKQVRALTVPERGEEM